MIYIRDIYLPGVEHTGVLVLSECQTNIMIHINIPVIQVSLKALTSFKTADNSRQSRLRRKLVFHTELKPKRHQGRFTGCHDIQTAEALLQVRPEQRRRAWSL